MAKLGAARSFSDRNFTRRAFLRASAVGAIGVPWIRLTAAEAGPESDREFLDQCRGLIEKHRKEIGVVRLRHQNGKPIVGARVQVQQVRHEFLFGCNFFRFARLGNEELEAKYREKYSDLLNFATLPFYWATYERRRGEPGYEYSSRAAAWCREHGITCKGHPLVWDHPAGNPAWLPDDSAEVGQLSHNRVRDIVRHFRGQIDMWDVVNEAVHLGSANKQTRMSRWATPLGAWEFVKRHLEIARAANAKATLLVNDYRLDPPYRKLLESLQSDSPSLFDVVGMQSHMHDHPWPLKEVWNHCERYAGLGLPLHFTEATVVSGPRTSPGENWGPTTSELERKQADYVASFYTTLFAHPEVQALTWWDFSDNGAWQGAAAGFLRKDMSPKPVYERLHALIKDEWWTRAAGSTDTEGCFSTRAFYGVQRIMAELPDGRKLSREVAWGRGQANEFELTA